MNDKSISNEVLEERINNLIGDVKRLEEKFDKFLERKENKNTVIIATVITSIFAFGSSIIALLQVIN